MAETSIKTPDGTFSAYVAAPKNLAAGKKAPGLVVIQEILGFNEAKGVQDLIASLDHLRKLPNCNGKAGSVGYCLGGKLAYLMATRSNADANVSYYGGGIDNLLN